MGQGMRVSAFDNLVTFEMRLPSVRVDRERSKWFAAMERVGLIPPLGSITGEYMPEVQLCQLLAVTATVEVVDSENEALQGLASFWTLARITDSQDAEAVKQLHEQFLDLFSPLVDKWWQAHKMGEQATITRDPIRLPLDA